MKIVPIPALDDNYIWLIHDEESAVCVDPGDAAPVLAMLQQKQLDLDAIVLTHHHNDHTSVVWLLYRPLIPIWPCMALKT